jgi:aldehyde:ferredoxin oxidoreductase
MALSATINLTTQEINVNETDPALLKKWLGGRGLGAALLYDLVGPDVQPLDPGNYLIFTTGAFNGTAWPASARYHVTFKSPATEAYGYANAGGYFGAELRKSGFDALVITGKAAEPLMIKIIGDQVTLLPAAHLWGLTTSQVDAQVLNEGGRVVSIGQAGENQVTMAAIMSDEGRAAARSGPGAVMGSKNLKAVHVIATEKRVPTPDTFPPVAKKTSQYVLKHPRSQLIMEESTLFLMQTKQMIGDLPARNHQSSSVPFIDNIDTKAFGKYWVKRKGCSSCPIRCSRRTELVDGDQTIGFEGPEYETANAFGPMCWNGDPEVIIKANHLCNEYGMDTISAGVTIAFAMECHEKGLLNDPDLSLEWGDPDSILGLLKKMAFREGIGDILSHGTRGAAEEIGRGAEAYAMQVKGVEMPRQEPRSIKGMALTHAVANRGADHLYSLATIDTNGLLDIAYKYFPEEIVLQLMETRDETYKPELVIHSEHFCAIVDSLGVCKFSTVQNHTILPEHLAEGLQAIGIEITEEELFALGERIVNIERQFNVRNGLGRADDMLPKRFLEEPLDLYLYEQDEDADTLRKAKNPIATGLLVDLEFMLDKYYSLRGWDANGAPTPETLERLGLLKQ